MHLQINLLARSQRVLSAELRPSFRLLNVMPPGLAPLFADPDGRFRWPVNLRILQHCFTGAYKGISLRVLLIGSDSSLGLALVYHLRRWGRHDVELVSSANARWKSDRQAKKEVRRARADVLVDVRIQAAVDSGELLTEQDVERCHWLAKACQRSAARYLLVSTARVFSGLEERARLESDIADSDESVGQLVAQAEELVRSTCERHLVLRLGPVFSHEGINVLTHMLEQLLSGGTLMLGTGLRGCPVEASDAARVVAGMLDQFSAGAQAVGNFHYSSSDVTNCYEFAEVLLASTSQFIDFAPGSVQLQPQEHTGPERNRSLRCQRIRDTFAIKQVPWRSFVADTVRLYFRNRQQRQGVAHD